MCSNPEDKLQIYRENFEKAYIEATEAFYKTKAPQYLEANGVQNYMRYADHKLKEEEQRAQKYLETFSGSIQAVRNIGVVTITVNVRNLFAIYKCFIFFS